jgi:hypothetical protein
VLLTDDGFAVGLFWRWQLDEVLSKTTKVTTGRDLCLASASPIVQTTWYAHVALCNTPVLSVNSGYSILRDEFVELEVCHMILPIYPRILIKTLCTKYLFMCTSVPG